MSKEKELYEAIKSTTEKMMKDMYACSFEGNKSAGIRARKATLELEKMFKPYRKLTIEATRRNELLG